MRYILKGSDMKAVDAYTINNTKIPSMVLMERAACEAAKEIIERFDKRNKIVVVCGNGNNGADGLAVARILSEYGYHADYVYDADPERGTKEIKAQLEICENEDIKKVTISEIGSYNIIVDAIFGIGLSRDVEGIYREYIEKINESSAYIVSIDVPSGINADTGCVMGIAVEASLTITFGYEKYGIVMYPGTKYAGEIVVKKAGFSRKAVSTISGKMYTYEEKDLLQIPKRDAASNKGTYGKILIIAGSELMSGAAYLSAMAAYNTGAGIVRILSHSFNRNILSIKAPEAIIASYDTAKDEEIKDMIKDSGAIVIGPGMSVCDETLKLLNMVLEISECPVIIDADGLNVIAGKCEILKNRKCSIIVTPHVGEMSRLTGISTVDIKSDPVKVCGSFAKEYKVICVLKDARTVICDEDGDVYINTSGNSGMSTGGSGDVLTGIIGGLVLNGLDASKAARYGVLVHGLSGDYMAMEKSERSLIASDIIEGIGKII